MIDAVKNKKPVVWTQWCFSKLIFQGFDAVGVTTESFVSMGYTINPEKGYSFLIRGEEEGYLLEGCSSQKAFLGGILQGEIPEATAIVSYTHPCDSGITAYPNLENLTGIPSFDIDTPYVRDKDGIEYLSKQMEELIEFLEKHLNQKFNWVKFKKAVQEYNEFSMYIHEISQMMKAIPCPVSSIALAALWQLKGATTGTKEATESAKKIYEITKQRFKNGTGTIKKEKIRVVLWKPTIAFISITPWLEREFGAVIVSDYLSYHPYHQIDITSREKILEGLTMVDQTYGMSRQTAGHIENSIEDLVSIIEEYSPDCVIMSGHEGCKQEWAATRIYSDYCKKYNLPVLSLNHDIFDPRFVSEEEIKNQITKFFEENGWYKI